MIFQYSKREREDFLFQDFFLFGYFIKVNAEKMADGPHANDLAGV
jgi:hypothetical protein